MIVSTRSADQSHYLLLQLLFCLLVVPSTLAEHRVEAPHPRQQQKVTIDQAGMPAGIKNLFWHPNNLQQGSPAFVSIEFDRVPTHVTGRWTGRDLSFFKSPNPKIWLALAGADLETKPDSYRLEITATLPGRKVHAVKEVDISAANFLSDAVDVPENFVEPDAQGRMHIASDQILKNRAFAHLIQRPQWSGNFVPPVAVKPTNSFGTQRVFNEELSSTHRGSDFPVKEGVSVVASNSGTVVLAKELFYEGECVIVDHGQRFFTIYMHLSRIDVKSGERLEKGDKIGLSGATGRVTGPHLHMGVRWNGAYLNPTQLMSLTLPKLTSDTPRAGSSNQRGHNAIRSHRR